MVKSGDCLRHEEREARLEKIKELSASPQESPNENLRLQMKQGSEETSLRQLEGTFANTPEWKVIEAGGVLSIPVEELRMLKPPKQDRSGQYVFDQRKGEKQIDSYCTGRTIRNLRAEILERYNKEKERANCLGMSTRVFRKSLFF